MNEDTKIFFNFLLSKPEIWTQNYVSIDLLSHIPEDKIRNTDYRRRESLLKQDTVYLIYSFILSGYDVEIREKRYLTILEKEWTRIKRDIKILQIENKI